MTTPTIPAEAKVLAWFNTLGRRGDDGELAPPGTSSPTPNAGTKSARSSPQPQGFMFTVAAALA